MSSTTAGQVIRCKGTSFSFFLTFFVVDLVVVSLFQSCDCSMGFFPFLCCFNIPFVMMISTLCPLLGFHFLFVLKGSVYLQNLELFLVLGCAMIFCHSQKLELFEIGYTICVPKIIINTANVLLLIVPYKLNSCVFDIITRKNSCH